ncbi:MAG: hypothetical protein MJ172_07135 [Clostridia bacterium]|nr:hypothetical protein [Clostridia bacterium]
MYDKNVNRVRLPLFVGAVIISILFVSACNKFDKVTPSTSIMSKDTILLETEKKTEITTTNTTIEPAETEFITSLPYMRTIELDSNILPDGMYRANIKNFDETKLGFTIDVYGYYYLLDSDVELLNIGDTIFYGKLENADGDIVNNEAKIVNFISDSYDNVHVISLDENGDGVNTEYEYCIWKQYSNKWFLYKFCDGYYEGSYNIANDYHISISDDVLIFDNASLYEVSKELHDDFINSGYYWSIYTFEDFINECEDIEHPRRPALLIIVENGVISEIYINPDQHQDWHYHPEWYNG